MRRGKCWPAMLMAAAVAGCASSSEKIAASYVSPLQYQSYTCQQLAEEAQRISSRATIVSGVQDQKATNDAIATGVAIVLFWPAAFMVGGNDQTTAELARLKGEFEAVERASVQKNCGHQFRHGPAPTTTATISPGRT
jgi:hypothetical protein